MKKIVRFSITEQIFETLRDKIISGEWKPGDKIPSEVELSEMLGVSRMSLKMAIQKLNVLGLAETRVGEGTFVCQFSMKSYFSELFRTNALPQDYMQINDFRIGLEASCIQLAVAKGDIDSYMPELEGHFAKMQEALESQDEETFHQAHFDFHQCICKMTCNQLFLLIYEAIADVLFEVYKANTKKTWLLNRHYKTTIQHHRNILEALRSKDMEKCRAAQMNFTPVKPDFYI